MGVSFRLRGSVQHPWVCNFSSVASCALSYHFVLPHVSPSDVSSLVSHGWTTVHTRLFSLTMASYTFAGSKSLIHFYSFVQARLFSFWETLSASCLRLRQ